MTSSEIPVALTDLSDRLQRDGFVVVVSEEMEGFGDHVIVLAQSDLRVRLVRERGEWFLELGSEAWADLFDPDVWRTCLQREDVTPDPSPLADQARFVASALGQIREALKDDVDGSLSRCLLEKRASRAHRRLGLA